MSFFDPPGDRGWGSRTPGCLKSESEERETWTAGSLRTGSFVSKQFNMKLRSEETSDGLRFQRYIGWSSLTSDQFCGPRQNVKFCASEKTRQGKIFSPHLGVRSP